MVRDELYLKSDRVRDRQLREIAPEYFKAYVEFDNMVMSDGALPKKVKQLIAVAVAHTTQCPFCIDFMLRKPRRPVPRHGN